MSAIDTRNQAYFDHRDSGALTRQQRSIMRELHGAQGPDWSLQEIVKLTGFPINVVSGRINELKNRIPALIEESSQRKCSISGRTVTPVRLRGVQMELGLAA